jgi:hypothetical protein
MTGEPKVLLCKLFERTSANGNRYMFGRLGNAKIIVFVDRDAELKYGAEVVWNVFVQAAEQDDSRQSSTPSSSPRRSPRRSAPDPRGDAPADGDGRPFDDDLPEQLR